MSKFNEVGFPKSFPRKVKNILLRLAGVGKQDEGSVIYHGDEVVEVQIGSKLYEATYLFDFSSMRVSILWMFSDKQGRGWGAKKFKGLARKWKKFGFRTVIASPADGPNGGMTGYYVWPRLGFDGFMSPEQAEKAYGKLGEEVPDDLSIGRLMASPEGREVWLKHGSRLYGLTYDLS